MRRNLIHLTILALLAFLSISNSTVMAQTGGDISDITTQTKVEPAPKGPAPDTYLQGAELQLSPANVEGDRYVPQVAYNSVDHEYLVVWHNTWGGGFRDIYARRVSSTGEVLSWFSVASGAGTGGDGKNCLQPSVAFNFQRREYLVVYMYEDSANVYQVRGRVIPWNGPGTNPEKFIFSWVDRSIWSPHVAFNPWGGEFMVVWNAFNTTSGFPPGFPNDIGGTRVEFDGDVINPGAPFSWTSTDSPHQVDIAYNASHNEYLLTYVTVHSSMSTKNDIDAIQISDTGALLNPPGIKHIAQNIEDENNPAVSTDGLNTYIVAWDLEISPTNHNVWAVTFDWETNIGAQIFAVNSTDDDTQPDISYNTSGDWMLVWQRSLSGAGHAIIGWWNGVSNAQDIANYAFWENEAPAVAAGHGNYLTAYEGESPTANRHIYGVLWSPNALFMPVIRK